MTQLINRELGNMIVKLDIEKAHDHELGVHFQSIEKI